MLNMDQHNHNAKKLNIPMTIEDFVKNLRGCNGNNDFDQKMLEAVFTSIKYVFFYMLHIFLFYCI